MQLTQSFIQKTNATGLGSGPLYEFHLWNMEIHSWQIISVAFFNEISTIFCNSSETNRYFTRNSNTQLKE